MKDFKFFQKEEKGTLDIIDGVTYSSASFNADTPDGHVYRRHLYHTQREAYDRLRGVYDNERSEIPRGRFGTPERHQDILRRLQMTNDSRDLNETEQYLTFFSPITVTKVNPKFWTKVKMFFQKLSLYSDQVLPITVIATTVTFIVILILSKILNVW